MEREIRFKNYLAYGVGDFVGGGAQMVIGTLFLFFLIEVVGLSPVKAGLAIMVGKVWDGLFDPLMGYFSDQTKSRFGRRRVYFITCFIPMGLFFSLLWLPVKFSSENLIFAWYLFAYIFFNTFLTALMASHTALNADMSRDEKKRYLLTLCRLLCSGAAGMLSGVIPAVIIRQFPDQRGYMVMGAVFGLFYSLPYIFTFFGTWELPQPVVAMQKRRKRISDIYRDFFTVFINKSFRVHLGMYIFAFLTMDLVMALFIYYVTFYLGQGERFSTLMLALFAGHAALPVYLKIGNLYGKGKAYLVGIALWASGLVATLFYTPATPLIVLMIGPFIMGLGQCGAIFTPWAIFPSVTDVDELITTRRRAGTYSGMMTLLRKLIQASILFLVALVIGLLNLSEGAAQSAQAIQGLRLLWFFGPMLLLGLAFTCGIKFKVTPKNHQIMMAEINRLSSGGAKEDVDAETKKVCELLTGKKYAELYQPYGSELQGREDNAASSVKG